MKDKEKEMLKVSKIYVNFYMSILYFYHTPGGVKYPAALKNCFVQK